MGAARDNAVSVETGMATHDQPLGAAPKAIMISQKATDWAVNRTATPSRCPQAIWAGSIGVAAGPK
ncbi:Uncharacterised protein [Mycobacteroides abscessus subsp. abscessus]|nr:Uncharacterised protein [Mycobacteroides abscessus subsp. abscessus]